MKKLMCAIAAVSAGICLADVESANIVGYQTIGVDKGETKVFGLQFEDVSANNGISLDKLFTCPDLVSGTLPLATVDQIWIYKQADGWRKYYYHNGTPKYWADNSTRQAPTQYPILHAGDTFFFQRAGGNSSSATTLTLSGGIVPLAVQKKISVEKGETAIACNPWPVGIKINDFHKYYDNPISGTMPLATVDQVWTYKQSEGWKKYYYHNGTPKYWADNSTRSAIVGDPEIAPGEAFFFQRAGGNSSSATELSFDGPEYKGE